MKNTIINALEEDKIKFEIINDEPELTVFRFFIGIENTSVTTVIHLRTEWKEVAIYTICPTKVPVSHRLSVSEFITRANNNNLLGNFELDFDNGQISLKSSYLYDDSYPNSEDIFNRNLYATFNMLDKYLPGIMSVIYGNAIPKQAINLIEKVIDHSLN